MSQVTFSELGLAAPILEALAAAGYEQPTEVQAQAVPAAIGGSDLLVSSQTGSGKTAAFMLPSLQRLTEKSPVAGRGPRVLVLTPTRELAIQVNKAALTYGAKLNRMRTVTLVGGSPYAQQLRMLERPIDVVVATPGRLLDHLQQGRIDFGRLEVLVLDEADRMLDMGFVDDIEAIVARTPETRQTLLFSATLDGTVGQLARRLTRDPKRIDIEAPKEETRIDQVLMYADDLDHKGRLLDALLRDTELQQAVVFAATRRSAEDLALQLTDSGFSASALHGDMHQGQRNRTLQRLREGRTRVLVATDVAARGIDVAGISHVINFDSPRNAEDYVHRIGRTGRAGRTGVAITLFNHHEAHRVRDIERYTGNPIRISTIPGLEPVRRPAKPRFGGKGGPRRNGAPGGFGGGRGGFGGGRGFGDSRGFGGERSFGGDRGHGAPRNFGGDRGNFGGDRGNFAGDRGEFRGNSDRGFGGDRGSFGGDRGFNGDRGNFGGDRGNFRADRGNFRGGERSFSNGERNSAGGDRSFGGERSFAPAGERGGYRGQENRSFGGGYRGNDGNRGPSERGYGAPRPQGRGRPGPGIRRDHD